MSLEGKNRKVFSYNNEDRRGSNFMYKNFEKCNSYHTNFCDTNFNYASLRGAKMKYCNFSGASFVGTEFVGTNLRGSNFCNAHFEDAIFNATVLDNTIFKNATFQNCYFINTGIGKAKCFPENSSGITFFSLYPATENFSEKLIQIVESLRENDIIRRSHTLHLKGGKINTLSLFILIQSFSEEDLIARLPKIPNLLTGQFYTLSYLERLLKKAE